MGSVWVTQGLQHYQLIIMLWPMLCALGYSHAGREKGLPQTDFFNTEA